MLYPFPCNWRTFSWQNKENYIFIWCPLIKQLLRHLCVFNLQVWKWFVPTELRSGDIADQRLKVSEKDRNSRDRSSEIYRPFIPCELFLQYPCSRLSNKYRWNVDFLQNVNWNKRRSAKSVTQRVSSIGTCHLPTKITVYLALYGKTPVA